MVISMSMKKLLAAVLSLLLLLSFSAPGVVCAEKAGGWKYNQGNLKPAKNPDALAAFKKALEGLVGVNYEPVAYLGSQVVQGTNYGFLCKKTVVTPNAKSSYALVYVYQGLDGNAKITDVKDGADKRTTTKVNIRKGPGTRYKTVKTVKSGKTVRVYGSYGDWAMIKCGDAIGWMCTKYLH